MTQDTENQIEDIDPNDVALALAQGMCAGGMEPGAAAHNAWMAGVPAFFQARQQYAQMVEAFNRQQQQVEG